MNYPAASSGVSGIELPISLTPQAAGNSTLVGLKQDCEKLFNHTFHSIAHEVCSGGKKVDKSNPDPTFLSAMRYTYVIESGKDGSGTKG
ncbi:MAG: hypothetical protein O6918_12875 [Deltaproteobacteria bacterium]|nr:hypothetical protein [Deltaproteobacteria bacterium]